MNNPRPGRNLGNMLSLYPSKRWNGHLVKLAVHAGREGQGWRVSVRATLGAFEASVLEVATETLPKIVRRLKEKALHDLKTALLVAVFSRSAQADAAQALLDGQRPSLGTNQKHANV